MFPKEVLHPLSSLRELPVMQSTTVNIMAAFIFFDVTLEYMNIFCSRVVWVKQLAVCALPSHFTKSYLVVTHKLCETFTWVLKTLICMIGVNGLTHTAGICSLLKCIFWHIHFLFLLLLLCTVTFLLFSPHAFWQHLNQLFLTVSALL